MPCTVWSLPAGIGLSAHFANFKVPDTLGQGKLAARNSRGGRQSRFCLRVELVQRQTVMHYQAARARAFLRIVVATPNLVAQARGAAARPSSPPNPERDLGAQTAWSRKVSVFGKPGEDRRSR